MNMKIEQLKHLLKETDSYHEKKKLLTEMAILQEKLRQSSIK